MARSKIPLQIFLALSLLNINSLTLAAKYVDYYDSYDSSSSDEGAFGNKIFFKLKGTGIMSKSKASSLPSPTRVVDNSKYNLVADGFGGEVSSSVFFSEYLASEIALGFHVYNTKQKVINDIGKAYGNTGTETNKNLNIYSVPLHVIFQYSVAPFGGITPYVGLGYGGSFFFTRNKAIKIKPLAFGPILQAGCDFWAQDNSAITFEIKKQFLSSKISYKSSFLNSASDIPNKIKLNPLMISVGLTYKF